MNSPSQPPAIKRLLQRLLGTDSIQRGLVRKTARAGGVYLACLFALCLNVSFGFGNPVDTAWVAAYMLTGPVVFTILTRSGATRQFRDPAMITAQTLYAVSALVLAYPVNGPARGTNLLVAGLLPLFGFFTMSRRQVHVLSAVSLASFGTMMLGLALLWPERFDPRIEALHFSIAALCLPGMALLQSQIIAMRDRVSSQRLELQQALTRVEAVSVRDELTGLINRRHMTALLEEELRRRARYAQTFCVALLDIDHFKRINDTQGHAQGDEVLRRFSHLAGLGLAPSDVLARWGGEEFLLLLPATSLEAAASRLEQIRQHVRNPDAWRDEPNLQVSFSAGLSGCGIDALHEILERADQALYAAKAAGRDRVVASP